MAKASSASALQDRRQRIVGAAAELFLEQGFQVNVAAVAQRAQVSKQTVYSHFGTKEALFHAAIDALVAPLRAALVPDGRELRAALLAFGELHLERSLDPATAALSRRLGAEAQRFPAAAQALFDAGPDALRRSLAQRLAQAADAGQLQLADNDSDAAAELLLGLLNGLDTERRRLGLAVRDAGARQRWVRRAVALFLRGCAVAAVPDHLTPGPAAR